MAVAGDFGVGLAKDVTEGFKIVPINAHDRGSTPPNYSLVTMLVIPLLASRT